MPKKRPPRRDKNGRFIKYRQKLPTPKRGKGGRFVSSKPKRKKSPNKQILDPLDVAAELHAYLIDEEECSVHVDESRTKWREIFHDYLISWPAAMDSEDDAGWFEFIAQAMHHVLKPHYKHKTLIRINCTTEYEEKGALKVYTDDWLTVGGYEEMEGAIDGMVGDIQTYAIPRSNRKGGPQYRVLRVYGLSINTEAPSWYGKRGESKDVNGRPTSGKVHKKLPTNGKGSNRIPGRGGRKRKGKEKAKNRR